MADFKAMFGATVILQELFSVSREQVPKHDQRRLDIHSSIDPTQLESRVLTSLSGGADVGEARAR